jgi:hypothetical protein
MRYMYQTVGTPIRQRAVTETVESTSEGEVEVYVNAMTYDAILAVLTAHGDGSAPSDIAAVFQHRGPFTVICDPTVA